MKKYNIQLLINSQSSNSCWKSLESGSVPKMINAGVIKIDDTYFNAINVEELIILENLKP